MNTFLICDVETTGLDSTTNDITEIGLVLFNKQGIISCYSSLNEPSVPLSDKTVCKATGLTAEMLIGHKIDWTVVEKMIIKCSYILAHKAEFDRSFVKKYVTSDKPWLCSLQMIDWTSKGFTSRKLGHLCADSGFILNGAHRAINDCLALQRLITPYLDELVANSLKKEVITTRKIDFSNLTGREQAKADGFKWDGGQKLWTKSEWV